MDCFHGSNCQISKHAFEHLRFFYECELIFISFELEHRSTFLLFYFQVAYHSWQAKHQSPKYRKFCYSFILRWWNCTPFIQCFCHLLKKNVYLLKELNHPNLVKSWLKTYFWVVGHFLDDWDFIGKENGKLRQNFTFKMSKIYSLNKFS